MKDSTKESMFNAIRLLYIALPNETLKSSTTDQGKEFACYKKVERLLEVSMHFADAYSTWQRGSNENSSGLLRVFYPKKQI